jgi:peroxiredoxin Q/BCP
MEELPDFELRNAGVGPDPLTFTDIAEFADFAIVLFLRDYHCPKCRAQVNRVAEKAELVEKRGAAVVPVLPNSYGKATTWQEKYDIPFPLLADPAGELGEEYDQKRRFGAFGRLHDVIGRMPKTVLLDLRAEPRLVEAHDGATPGDRPDLEELLDSIDEIRNAFVFDCELVEC